MSSQSHGVGLARRLFLAALAVASLMSAYEILKQALFPHISIWQSHAVTISFTTILAVLTAYFLARRLADMNRKLQAEMRERERTGKALEQSEARYRHLFERNRAGVYRSSPERGFVDCNDAFARMFGYEREELLKLSPAVLYIGGAEERAARIAALRKARQFTDYENSFRHKNGSTVWVIQNTTIVQDEEGREVSEGTVVDVTARHLLGERLRQTQKMEAIGQLAGGIAHDFNNLLTVVLGYNASLRERLKDNEEAREDLNRIAEAAEKAASLIAQLLAFSRKQVLQPSVININRLVTNLDKLLRRIIGENVELITKTAPRLGKVKADPGQMEQVIMNLVVNARDAMPRGGKVTLETANVILDENYAASHAGVTPGAYVMVAVSDTGEGMTSDVQAQIFDPFFTTKELGRGTGLGLSTVYGIVQQSGGHIWVYSEVGHGTTFKIYLPQATEETEREGREHGPVHTVRGDETILLVEDDHRVRELTHHILTACGYSVLVAQDSRAAVSMGEHYAMSIHLLLTDVIMPEINGRELANHLRGRNPAIRVLYVSGYTENVIGERGVLEPGIHFLQKPFTPAALAHKVREVLDEVSH